MTRTAKTLKFRDFETPGANKDVVRVLEEMLKRALRGQVVSVAIAWVDTGCGCVEEYEIGTGDFAHLTGSVTALQFELMQKWLKP